jgi:hypothetical protein
MNKVRFNLFLCLFLSGLILTAGSSYSFAANQVITLSPSSFDQTVGNEFMVTIFYDVGDSDNTLSSLGVRIHFDSMKLDYKGFADFFNTSSLADPQLQDDDYNEDNDDSTDMLINISYSDPFDKSWPNEPLPLELMKLRFEVRNDASSGETLINVSRITGHVGYGFIGTGLEVILK